MTYQRAIKILAEEDYKQLRKNDNTGLKGMRDLRLVIVVSGLEDIEGVGR